MSYRVLVDSRVATRLGKLPKRAIERIDKAIARLSENPRPAGVKMLRGRLQDGWRVRVGEYRILYRIDDLNREVRIFEIDIAAKFTGSTPRLKRRDSSPHQTPFSSPF